MTQSQSSFRDPVLRRWAAGFFGVALLECVMVFFHHRSEWTYVYVSAARALRDGADIYVAVPDYRYPPIMAFLLVPLVDAPEFVVRLIWCIANLVAVVILVRSAWRLCGAPAGALSRAAVVRERWVFVAGIACCAPFLLSAQAHQQVDIFIAALLVAGCLELTRGRDLAGGALIGLAAAVKGPPLMFIGYLAFRRRWAAAGLTFVVAIVTNLLPDLFLFPGQGQLRLMAWIQGSVITTLFSPIGTWLGFTVYNQSLAGTVQRVNSTWPHAIARGFDFVPSVSHVPDSWLKVAVYGVLIALAAASVVAALSTRTRSAAPPAEYVQPSRTALEMATMAMLVQLASPMTDLAHMGPVILAALCLARLAFLPGEWRSRLSLAVALIIGVFVNKDLVGGRLYDLAVWSGAGAWASAALWAGCVSALARGLGEAPAPSFRLSIFDRLAPAATKAMPSPTP